VVGLLDVDRCSASGQPTNMLLIGVFRWAMRVLLPRLRATATRGAVAIAPSSLGRGASSRLHGRLR